jgi:hypothetical protein
MKGHVAELQRPADEAAAEEARVIAEAQPLADLGNAILAVYRARGVPEERAFLFARSLIPLIVDLGDRS